MTTSGLPKRINKENETGVDASNIQRRKVSEEITFQLKSSR